MYTLADDGTLNVYESDKKTYLDFFMGGEIPSEFEEITEENLTEKETIEFNETKIRMLELLKNNDHTEI